MANLTTDQVKNMLDQHKQSEDNVEVSLDDVDSQGNKESILEMYTDIASYNKMLKERITFVNKDLTKAIPFTRENLYLMCAYSGSGKSTVAANVSFPLWKEGKKAVIISNEESKQDVIFRVACLELGYNFNDYKKGVMPKPMIKDCMVLFPEIAKYIKVIDVNYKNGLTTKIEGVKNILDAVSNQGYSCILLDYFQLVKYSVGNPNASTYESLNDLRVWLGRYIKRSDIPVVVFAQLHSIGKRANKDLDSRVKECPAIIEPSTVVIEIIPDFENRTSSFIIHKDRFGLAGHRIECAFERGRFVSMSDDVIQQRQVKEIDDIEDKAGVAPAPVQGTV